MSDIETKVRASAMALHDAIKEARAAGYKVDLPHQVDGLPGIAVSETAKVTKPDLDPTPRAAEAPSRRPVPVEPKPLA